VADGTGIGRINDNDPPPTIAVLDAMTTEGDAGTHNMSFKLQLSAPSGKSVTVTFKTSNGTAVAPSDYTAKTVTVTIAAGQTVKLVPVVIRGDTAIEPNQIFNVTLSAPVNVTIADGTATGRINNDD
jgi:chitinase